MKISLNWLKDFVAIPAKTDPHELARELTMKTAEVDGVESQAEKFDKMVIGQVLKVEKHPNADKLKVVQVSIGTKNLQIVCGGVNLKEGMYVPITLVGSIVKWHGEGEPVKVEKTKIRGVESEGMIAQGVEIGLNMPNEGPDDITDLSEINQKPGTPLAEALEFNDTIIEFDNKSLTHRPDLWGHYGIAREIAAITEAKLKPFESKVKFPEKGETVDVKIEDYKLCPRYLSLVINNVKIGPSPEWMQNRLRATGHGVHNNIVDVTNYVMHELGQPMHAFDKNYLEGSITVRAAKAGEKMKGLDDKEHALTAGMIVVTDQKKIVGLAGILGAKNSEINEKTTEVVLEAANFHAGIIRKTSSHLNLRTDAAQRFEKSLDPNLPLIAMKRAAELILEMCPGSKIAGPITDNKKIAEKPLLVDLDCEKTSSKIGVKISQAEIKKILEKLGFKCTAKNKKILSVEIPHFRPIKDIEIEDDLIEEVVRIYGYDNIAASLPTLPTKLPIENTERFKKHRLRELLSFGLGFDEVYNYSFYSRRDFTNCLMKEEGHLKILNYLSEDQTHMRTSLVPNLLKNVATNIRFFDEFKIYEIGHTYKEIGEYMPLEEKMVGGTVVTKSVGSKGSALGQTDNPFYLAKGAVEAILAKWNVPARATEAIENAPYAHPVKSMTYLDNSAQPIAKVFMLHPAVAKNYDLEKYSVALFELNFTELMKKEHPQKKYKPIPKFPAITIDVSVLIDKQIEIATLQDAITKSDPALISAVELFDIYQGENIATDKKAVAFKITLQAEDRTLTDAEMSQTQQKIFHSLERLGGLIRGK